MKPDCKRQTKKDWRMVVKWELFINSKKSNVKDWCSSQSNTRFPKGIGLSERVWFKTKAEGNRGWFIDWFRKREKWALNKLLKKSALKKLHHRDQNNWSPWLCLPNIKYHTKTLFHKIQHSKPPPKKNINPPPNIKPPLRSLTFWPKDKAGGFIFGGLAHFLDFNREKSVNSYVEWSSDGFQYLIKKLKFIIPFGASLSPSEATTTCTLSSSSSCSAPPRRWVQAAGFCTARGGYALSVGARPAGPAAGLGAEKAGRQLQLFLGPGPPSSSPPPPHQPPSYF